MRVIQRKVLILSGLLHGLLLLLLILGPAFAPKRPPQLNSMPVLHVIPSELVDALISGGGEPPPAASQAEVRSEPEVTLREPERRPEPEPEPAPPVVRPEPVERRDPPKPVVEPPKPAAKPQDKPKDKPKDKPVVKPKQEIKVSDTLIKPKADPAREARERAAEVERKRQQEAARALEQSVARANAQIRAVASSSTKIDIPGPGGGGAAFANWNQAVVSEYDRYWVAPSELKDDRATVVVEVVVNHDGKVLRDRIVSRSGIAALDNSVQAALDAVRRVGVPKFPSAARASGELQRTVRINFNLSSKLRLG
ncbi:MAG: TonB terminal [Verrucomicrobiota bacterium]|jgi:protein TonB